MIRGLYTSVSGLAAAEQRQKLLAQSIANANTPGYKTDDATTESFEQIFSGLFDPGAGTQTVGQRLDLGQGAMVQTNAALDLALSGPGFFVLDSPNGPIYTRNGRFQRDAAGVLRSMTGLPVLGEDGQPIVVTGAEARVEEDGAVLSDRAPVGRLRLVDFAAADLQRAGVTGFSAAGAGQPADAKVIRGAYEQSNVDVSATMTSMVMLQRAFELGRTAIQLQNEALGAAVNQVGALR